MAALRAALGFLQLPPRVPELRLLHHWLDTWTGLGLVVVGVERRSVDMHAVLRVVTGDHEAIRRCVMSDDSVLAAG